MRLATFDLDGTLADTRHDIANALIRAIVDQGLRPPTVDKAIASIGWGAPALVVSALGSDQQDAVDRVQAAFREDYRRNIVVDTVIYEGIPALLTELRDRGVHLAVATNKPGALTRLLLKELDLARFFDHVIAPEEVRRPKPAPDMLLELIRRCSVRADETVMVGDMETDVESARAAGVRAVLLTVSGFHRPAELLAAADDVAASVTELSELLR
jgi:phosphoglycolate phosphatase